MELQHIAAWLASAGRTLKTWDFAQRSLSVAVCLPTGPECGAIK